MITENDFNQELRNNMTSEFKSILLDFVNNFLSKKLGKNLICCEKTEFGKIVEENDIGLAKNEGIILEAQDKSLRCRLTLVEAFSRILDTYRKDLVQTLFPDGGAKW